MKKQLNLIEEIKKNISSATGFFDGVAMMSMNPGIQNISQMFHERIEEAMNQLLELENVIKDKDNEKIEEKKKEKKDSYEYNIQQLKRCIEEINIFQDYPKLGSKEYLYIPENQIDLFFDLFDLEELKLESINGESQKFFIYSQIDEDKKFHNYTMIIGEKDEIYFYQWLEDNISKFNPNCLDLLRNTFVSYRKRNK